MRAGHGSTGRRTSATGAEWSERPDCRTSRARPVTGDLPDQAAADVTGPREAGGVGGWQAAAVTGSRARYTAVSADVSGEISALFVGSDAARRVAVEAAWRDERRELPPPPLPPPPAGRRSVPSVCAGGRGGGRQGVCGRRWEATGGGDGGGGGGGGGGSAPSLPSGGSLRSEAGRAAPGPPPSAVSCYAGGDDGCTADRKTAPSIFILSSVKWCGSPAGGGDPPPIGNKW